MEMKRLQPEVKDVKLWANGKNLNIQFYDLDGVTSEITMWEHRAGNFGEVSFKGINKEFLTNLAQGILDVINTMPSDAEIPCIEVESDAE